MYSVTFFNCDVIQPIKAIYIRCAACVFLWFYEPLRLVLCPCLISSCSNFLMRISWHFFCLGVYLVQQHLSCCSCYLMLWHIHCVTHTINTKQNVSSIECRIELGWHYPVVYFSIKCYLSDQTLPFRYNICASDIYLMIADLGSWNML